MGGIFGGGEQQSNRTEVNYPDWFDQLYIPALRDMRGIYEQQREQPVHPLAQMAYQGIAQRAMQGSPIVDQGMSYIQNMIAGGGQAPPGGQQPQAVQPQGPLAGINWSGAPQRPQPSPQQPQQPTAAGTAQERSEIVNALRNEGVRPGSIEPVDYPLIRRQGNAVYYAPQGGVIR